MVWGRRGCSTCTCGADSSGWFDGHVVPSQTGPQQPQHQAHASQRLHRLQAIPTTQARGSGITHMQLHVKNLSKH